jgi:unsaturated rhamnogalacturonyl hydrolase
MMTTVLLAWSVLAVAQPQTSFDADVQAVAKLAGQPAIVSAAGLTRGDTPIITIENPAPFDSSPARRLVLVGGLDGDDRTARLVLEAVRWLKISAPSSVRRFWSVSALPMANPDGHETALEFPPPDKGFFDDPQRPESRYVWRWITYQAPDFVVEFAAGPAGSTAFKSVDRTAGPRAKAYGVMTISAGGPANALQTFQEFVRQTTGHAALSRTHEELLARAGRDPLEVARVLATRYPQTPGISYIPAVAWTQTLRLAAIAHDAALRDRVRQQTQPWLSGERKLFGDRVQLTSVAGTMIFADIAAGAAGAAGDSATVDSAAGEPAAVALANEGAARAAEEKADGTAQYGQGWTDDMFMGTAILARAGARPGREHNLDTAARRLVAYAARLQRADGVFIHAIDGPFAWGRGNGFAALGLAEALEASEKALPAPLPARAQLLDIYKRQMAGLTAQQAPDGMWREVIDEPGSYRELTATAMIFSAMARGVRLGWLDPSYRPVAERAWRALAAHVETDGALVDVCESTGVGPTRRYYVDRKAMSGADDRGGAMALLASMERFELSR